MAKVHLLITQVAEAEEEMTVTEQILLLLKEELPAQDYFQVEMAAVNHNLLVNQEEVLQEVQVVHLLVQETTPVAEEVPTEEAAVVPVLEMVDKLVAEAVPAV